MHVKANALVLVLVGIALTTILVGVSNSLVSAQILSPCTTTLSYPASSTAYANLNLPVVVPIAATCATSYGSQLYATGNAYDTTTNTSLGSASAFLASVNGGTQFNGQLGFNLPQTAQGDSIIIEVSLYNSQYGNLLSATSETVQVSPVIQQTTTTTVTEYTNASPYPTAYSLQPTQPNSDPSQFQHQQATQTQNQPQEPAHATYSTNLYDYVVIIAILATVIIATTGLVVVARRQPTWPQPQYGPKR